MPKPSPTKHLIHTQVGICLRMCKQEWSIPMGKRTCWKDSKNRRGLGGTLFLAPALKMQGGCMVGAAEWGWECVCVCGGADVEGG